MKHSLQVLIRVGARPGPVRVEVEGCLTQASCPDLIRILDHGTRISIYAPSVPRPCTAVPGHVARYGSPSASRILSGGWR